MSCRECGKVQQHWPSAIRKRSGILKLKSYEEGASGPTYFCDRCYIRCYGRQNMRKATMALLATKRTEDGKKLPQRLTAEGRQEVLAAHMHEATIAAGGRAKVLEKSKEARKAGLSQRARDACAIGALLKRKRTRSGKFTQCILCHKFLYIPPRRLRKDAPGFHFDCYQQWVKNPKYARWCRHLLT